MVLSGFLSHSKINNSKHGFALPTVLIASMVMLMVLLASVSSTVAIRVSLSAQYYNQVARDAGDAGLAYAKACIADSNGVIQWSADKPLKPDTDCSGEPIDSCPSDPVDDCHFVVVNNSIISTFTVDYPASGRAADVVSKGSTQLLVLSDLAGGIINPWRGYNQIAKFPTTDYKRVSLSGPGSGYWNYKRSVTITNGSGGPLTDYQVKINPFTDSAFINNSNLVGSWHINEGSGTKAADMSGLNNTGTMVGSSNWGASGKFGSSLTGAGANNYLSLPRPADYNFTAPATIEGWLKTNSDTCQALFGVTEAATANNYQAIYVGNGCTGSLTNELVTITRAVGGVGTYVLGYTTLTRTELVNDQWHHVSVTFDGTAARIYIDGVSKTVSVASGTNNGSFGGITNPTDASIGSRIVSNTRATYLNGSIDEFKIYNRALSATEIANRYGTAGVPKVRGDYADLRFTSVDNNVEYSYWKETDKSYWIKIPSLPTGATAINMYYGNNSATDSSNGTNTFRFFDDFAGSTISTTKWTETDTNNEIQQNYGLNLTSVTTAWDSALISNTTFNRAVGLAVSGNFKTGSSVAAPNHVMVGWEKQSYVGPSYDQLTHGFYFTAGAYSVYEKGANYTASGTYLANGNYNFRVRLKSTGADYLSNGVATYSGVGGSYTDSPMRIGITQYNHTGTINNIYVHQSSVTEPTHSAPGAEYNL